MLGTQELIIILLIVLVLFGATKLPGLGDALGKSIKNFRRAASGDDELEVGEKLSSADKRHKLPSDAQEAEVLES